MRYVWIALLLAGCGATEYNPCIDLIQSGGKVPPECVAVASKPPPGR